MVTSWYTITVSKKEAHQIPSRPFPKLVLAIKSAAGEELSLCVPNNLLINSMSSYTYCLL